MAVDSGNAGSVAMAWVGWGLLALLGALGLTVFVLRHPFGLAFGGGIAIAFVALMSVRRDAWLLFVPALAPVVDLAGWSGAIHLTESDALVMSALLVGGVQAMTVPGTVRSVGRRRGRPRPWRFGVVQIGVVALLGISYLVSTQWSSVPAALGDAALWMATRRR